MTGQSPISNNAAHDAPPREHAIGDVSSASASGVTQIYRLIQRATDQLEELSRSTDAASEEQISQLIDSHSAMMRLLAFSNGRSIQDIVLKLSLWAEESIPPDPTSEYIEPRELLVLSALRDSLKLAEPTEIRDIKSQIDQVFGQ